MEEVASHVTKSRFHYLSSPVQEMEIVVDCDNLDSSESPQSPNSVVFGEGLACARAVESRNESSFPHRLNSAAFTQLSGSHTVRTHTMSGLLLCSELARGSRDESVNTSIEIGAQILKCARLKFESAHRRCLRV